MVKRIVWGALTVVCAAVILLFSWQSVESSIQLSGDLTDKLLENDTSYQQLSDARKEIHNDKVHDHLRSVAHVVTFASLAFCASMFVRTYTVKRWLHIVLPACMGFAVLDECVQHLHGMGRTFQLSDIGRDWLGILIGCVVVLAVVFLLGIIKNKGKQHGISGTGSGQLN